MRVLPARSLDRPANSRRAARTLLALLPALALAFSACGSPASPSAAATQGGRPAPSAAGGASGETPAAGAADASGAPSGGSAGPGGGSTAGSPSGGGSSGSAAAWQRLNAVEQPNGFMNPPIDGNGKPVPGCTPCHPSVDTIMTAVTNGPAGPVAVGWIIQGFRGATWSAADGSTWKLDQAFPEQSLLQSVAANGTRYVAVGRNGQGSAAWTSTTGGDWQRSANSAFAASPLRIQSIVAWRGGFAAAGFEGTEFGTARAAFWSSPDGLSWRRAADVPAFADARAYAVAAGPNALVAVGTSGPADQPGPAAIWTSLDGQAWLRIPATSALQDARLRAVAASPGIGFVAVGEDLAGNMGAVLVSADGRTWRRAPASPALGRSDIQLRMLSVAAGGPGVVAAGTETDGVQYNDATIWTSADGIHWTLLPFGVDLLDGEFNGLGDFGDRLLGVGDRGAPDAYVAQVWISPAGWGHSIR